MIILSALLMFFGLLIDFSRIKLAELQAETAVQAAVRSGLSYFDDELQRFGLYAMSSEQASRKIARQIVSKHVDTMIENSFEIDSKSHLGSQSIFKEQVLEEMKYKAPIEFSLEIIDKFNNTAITEQIHAVTALHKQLDQLEEFRIQREDALDRVRGIVDQWMGPTGMVSAVHEFYEQKLAELELLAKNIQGYTRAEVIEQIASVQTDIWLYEDSFRDQYNELDILQDELNDTKNKEKRQELENEIDEIRDDLDQLEATLDNLAEELDIWQQKLAQIEQFKREVTEMSMQIEQDVSIMNETFTSWQRTFNEASQFNQQIRRELEQAISKETIDSETMIALQDDFVINQGVFNEYREQAATTISLFQSFANLWMDHEPLSGSAFLNQAEQLTLANKQYDTVANSFFVQYRQWDDQRVQQNDHIETEQTSTLKKITSKLDELSSLFTSCDGQPTYDELKLKEKHYLHLNELDDIETGTSSTQMPRIKEATAVSDESIGILGGLQKAMLSVRDRTYVNEYALMHFNYRTYDSNKNSSPIVKSNPSQRLLHNQEVEYILYGFGSCQANQMAAFVEMFTLRMGIRTMETMLDSKKIGRVASPWLAFLLAALEGAIQAFDDMKQLVDGQEVPLSARWSRSITLNYKDYLRLFMLIHGNELNMIARMQALIDWNTGRALETKYTFAEVEMRMETTRWFLPGRTKVITRYAAFSY